ncbi:type VII secretion protein EccCa [Actinomadura darangshiensis]|uniref:Type VII secretion protein EccCa n=1 Tax=Actinomadura darangshiensis TaxID=705336 RepID=A0A4R5ANY2_9ACTN|nr:type VII secretion protein EccCa [Actinomadura darangshiensis]TDD73815.1 type VII secretion protein EccCa [Actinomadura darangshiensis]
MSTVVVRRRPRVQEPRLPEGDVQVEAPPEIPATGAWIARGALSYVPVAAGAATGVLLLLDDSSGRLRVAAAMLITVSVLGGLIGILSSRQQHRTTLRVQRHNYLRHLAQVDETMRRASIAQRKALSWRYPRPAGLWSLAMGRRLWERRPFDSDFVQVRLAVGPQKSTVALIPPETGPVEDLDPVCAEALRGTVRAHSIIAEMPVALALGAFARITFTGDAARIRGLVRAVAAQLAVFHAPKDVRISVCASSAAAPLWDWVKWLPHTLDPNEQDAIGPVRLVTTSLTDLEARLGDELERPRFTPTHPVSGDRGHHVVIFDGGLVDAESVLAVEGLAGVTVLDLGGDLSPLPAEHTVRLHVAEDELRVLEASPSGPEPPTVIGKPDFLAVAQAAALARQLAPLRVESPASVDGALGSVEVPLTRLLDVRDPAAADRHERPPRHRLRVPIGLDSDGRPVELDLKEAAQLGMGPHGLVVGATGSGKSELLRTLILGLAATHSSDAVNLLLVDYKGAATFQGFEDLRHVSAIVTDLEDEPPLVDRLSDAVNGEMVRRQELLRAAGNYASVRDYERDREQGADLEPLPELLVVIDEFSDLLTAKPDFVELLVMMGRLGRSLGVHMLLASQRLEEGRLRGLDAHLSYRIGMRTFSASESRAVLGVPDAYELPAQPGWGFLRVGTDELVRFRAAYVSGPAAAESAPQAVGPRIIREIQPFVAEYVRPEVIDPAEEPDQAPEHAESLMDEVVGRLAGQGPPAHRIWLPPLDVPPSLDELLPDLPATPPYGGEREGDGRLAAPVGIVDRPFEHRRDPLWLDLSSAGGNAGIVGAPQSGKSTLLRTLITSLALRYTPDEACFYCLDFGGGSLHTLAALPHVGGVAARTDAHKVGRTVAEVTQLLERREREPAGRGAGSGDVVLVVDGWRTLRDRHEQLEPVIADLAARGPGFGIHVVATATSWGEFRPNFGDLLGTRLEFRLGDPYDSQINRKLAAGVPADAPGRGLTSEEGRFIAALPRIDGRATVDDLPGAVTDLVGTVAGNWRGPAAPPVRVLPSLLPVAALPGPVETGHRVPIGIDEERLAPVLLDFVDEPRLAVLGDPGCGKSSLLKLIAEGVAARHAPDEARLFVIDPRRSQLDSPQTEHLTGYAPSAAAAVPLVAEIRDAIQQRLARPNLTPEELLSRSWWTGPELYLFVDDAELLETSADPLLPLMDVLPHAHDIGLHLVFARTMGGAGRAMFMPVLRLLKETASPALIMSGPRDEGALLGGIRPSSLPPGRGWFYERGSGSVRLIQVGYDEPKGPPAR